MGKKINPNKITAKCENHKVNKVSAKVNRVFKWLVACKGEKMGMLWHEGSGLLRHV